MKIIPIVFLLAAVVMGVTSCGKPDAAPAAEEQRPAEPGSRLLHGSNGAPGLKLDAATQKIMGLEVAPLAAMELAPEIKGFGRVVDPAPLVEMLMELGKAQLSLDNSHQELERMKVLKQDSNASERAFQTAEATYQQNFADVTAVWYKIQKNFGDKIAQLAGPLVVVPGTERKPDRLLHEIGDGREVFLVRLDLPASEPLSATPVSARIVGAGETAIPVPAEYFGELPAIDPQTQAHGYFFLVSTNRPKLTPGMAVTAFVQTADAAQAGVLVPRDALLRFNGTTWIYLLTGSDNFQRVEVKLDRPLASGWFVREGVKAQDQAVTVGAQQLLSEELKGQIGGD